MGRYFNYADTQDGSKDFEAGIQLDRNGWDSGTALTVIAHVTTTDSYLSNFQNIGNVSPGQTAKLRVKWDKVNHQFIFQLNADPVVTMSYSGLNDTLPPSNAIKELWVGQTVPNCTTTPTGSVMMDAYFDNVYVSPY